MLADALTQSRRRTEAAADTSSPLLRRYRVPSRVAVATGVHLWRFSQSGGDAFQSVLALTMFTVPGVIVGGQLGPMLASRISQHVLEKALGGLFLLVGLVMLWKVMSQT